MPASRLLRAALLGAGTAAATLAWGCVDGSSALAGRGPRCVPTRLNTSDVLRGNLAVSPLPGSYDASPDTQISLQGQPASALAVRVSGSETGHHAGRLRPYSQGDGASFAPARAFRPGETVTIRGSVTSSSRRIPFSFQFTVAEPDVLALPHSPHPIRDPNEKQHYHSRPDIEPPAIVVTARSAQTAAGDIFTSPYNGPGPSGPMIFDEAGNLIWFDPMRPGTESTNLQVAQLEGRPVLTWWQGPILEQGFGEGEEVIADSSYRTLIRVHAGNGFKVDLHDFHLEPQTMTAVFTVFDPVNCDLSFDGGPPSAAVTDAIYQEVDLRTGLVRREWHSLDHVGLADSYATVRGSTSQWPFDYFHINSVDQAGDTTLVSARNTWAIYQINTHTGRVVTRIGGRHSDVRLAQGAATAFQHDAELRPDGSISIFDNGAVPKIHTHSRGIIVSLNAGGLETVQAEFAHPSPLLSSSQGNLQLLENGDGFIGWGAEPYFSEFSAGGQLLFDAHMHGSYESYRAYRFPWSGAPTGRPALAATAARPGSPVALWASWNGDTRTASWRVLAGPSPHALTPVLTVPRTGFETAIALPQASAYLAVQALDAGEAVLGESAAVKG
jgi:hypothetical protein